MSPIDRIAPTQRPAGNNDGTQQWRSLLFCHWQIPIDDLRPLVPRRLEIDTFDGQAYVALVPFEMRAIRPRWLPHWLAFNFYETNVRTYVLHNGRPGVYFFSLDASSRLAVWAARQGWSLPYHHASMSGNIIDEQHSYISQRWPDRVDLLVKFRTGKAGECSRPGSLEHFLFERYLLFVEHRRQIFEGQVHHQPYEVVHAEIDELQERLLAAAGLPAPRRLPDLAHYSPGVDVEVFRIRAVESRVQ